MDRLLEKEIRQLRLSNIRVASGRGEPASFGVLFLRDWSSTATTSVSGSYDEIRFAVENIKAFCRDPLPITLDNHEKGLAIAERYGYRIYGALILASALGNRHDSCAPRTCTMGRSSTVG